MVLSHRAAVTLSGREPPKPWAARAIRRASASESFSTLVSLLRPGGERGSVRRPRPSHLLDLDQRAGEVFRVEEQDRLAVGADFRVPVAEHARALGLELVAGGDDIRDLITE